jgi:Ca2+-transporting ATPase
MPAVFELIKEPHLIDATEVCEHHEVSVDAGLSHHAVIERQAQHGLNELPRAEVVPAWKKFIAQFNDTLILILIGAAVVSAVISQELKTPLVVLVVVLANAIIGFFQEHKAEAALDALRSMVIGEAKVRRDGEVRMVPMREIVPGDIVLVEAGDRIPADGRLLVAANLEIEEAALTGESQPVVKMTNALASHGEHSGLGDRFNMAFKNTAVTRGRGEFITTATGAHTEIGKIASLLRETSTAPTPLQNQLNKLAHQLAKLAGVIVALVVIIGLIRGESLHDLMLTAVALAVACIPEGLPAVTAVTLAIGVSRMADQRAIVKRLASVETLGCTSVICSDKTGTLTLNEMTARDLVIQNRSHDVSGEGYAPIGEIERHDEDEQSIIHSALEVMALCNDSAVHEEDGQWQLVGDPTEGAMVVLASKGGIDVRLLRERHPRIAEVPFDSATKFMATVHQMLDDSGNSMVRLCVKGAPDVLIERSTRSIGPRGSADPIEAQKAVLLEHNDRLASQGLRVLSVAFRDFDIDSWSEIQSSGIAVEELVSDLVLLALIGIVDPPRPEAREAIAQARAAGIAVKMITGDHATTAAAIGRELGLGDNGNVVSITGPELNHLTDEQLEEVAQVTHVFARVSPEHKIRLVAALQRRGHVVAMTGDGVNDAPALKKADIGVAMGITGTEVSKEAATMVLTDDNFATIVSAVRQGRAIYNNIVKFVRFQLCTTLGFAILFLLSSIFNIAGGKPFAAIAILWVNIIMDGPPAMALGLDPADDDAMNQKPRPQSEHILTKSRWFAIVLSAVVMAIGTLLVLALSPGNEAKAGVATIAGTMAFNTFVVAQFFNILNSRHDRHSVFNRGTLRNKFLWMSLCAVLLLQVGVTHLGPLQSLFDTVSISGSQWLICIAVASSVLWTEEIRKAITRFTRKGSNS